MDAIALSTHQQNLISELFTDLPDDFPGRYRHVIAIRDAFLSAMAADLATSMNSYLANQPTNTIDQCRELASNLNKQLNDLSLAIKCPQTGRPANLIVDSVMRGSEEVFRFRLDTKDERGRKVRSIVNHLSFDLIAKPPRIEALIRGYVPRRERER